MQGNRKRRGLPGRLFDEKDSRPVAFEATSSTVGNRCRAHRARCFLMKKLIVDAGARLDTVCIGKLRCLSGVLASGIRSDVVPFTPQS